LKNHHQHYVGTAPLPKVHYNVKGKKKVDESNNHQKNFSKFNKGKHNDKNRKNNVLCECSITTLSSSSQPVYLFVERVLIVVIFKELSTRLSDGFITQSLSKKRKHYTFSSLKSCLIY
jgi:hypothetical protein